MLLSSLTAKVCITPAQSDISQQEFSRCANDFYLHNLAVAVEETDVRVAIGFTFTDFVVDLINQAIREYKDSKPAHKKFTYYITGVDIMHVEDGEDKLYHHFGMRTHVIGILNSKVTLYIPKQQTEVA